MKNTYANLIAEIVDRRTSIYPEASAIIITYKRPRLFLDCLKSLKNQSSNNIEIIVVDNGGNDSIRKNILAHNPLYLRMKENTPVPIAKNIGCSFSKCPYVGFIDDDAICDKDFIKNALKTFESFPEVVAIRGKILPKSNIIFNKMQSHYDLGHKPLFGYYQEGCNFLKKEAWADLIHYSEKVYSKKLIMGHDGMIVIYGIGKKFGIQGLLYQPSMIMYHDYAKSLKHYIIKKKTHKRAMANYRKYFPEIISFYEKEYFPEKAAPNVLKKRLIDKIAIRIINFIMKIYLRYSE